MKAFLEEMKRECALVKDSNNRARTLLALDTDFHGHDGCLCKAPQLG